MLAVQVFFTACESMISNRVQCGFFGRVLALANVVLAESHQTLRLCAIACNARIRSNTAVNPWVNPPNCSRSSTDRTPHLESVVLTTWGVEFVSFAVAME